MNNGLHARSVTRRFSASAGTYDRAAQIQRRVALRLLERLAGWTSPRRILDVGCGTGLLTHWVADAFPLAEVEGVDAAPDLVAVARERLAGCERVRVLEGDAFTFRSEQPYDLVVSASSMHWMRPLAALFVHLHGLLRCRGRLAFGLMTRGTLAELRDSRSRVAGRKDAPETLPSADDVLGALGSAGFEVQHAEPEVERATYPTATDLLYALHEQGVTGGPVSTGGVPLTKGELASLVADYGGRYGTEDGGVYATYVVLYVLAQRR